MGKALIRYLDNIKQLEGDICKKALTTKLCPKGKWSI